MLGLGLESLAPHVWSMKKKKKNLVPGLASAHVRGLQQSFCVSICVSVTAVVATYLVYIPKCGSIQFLVIE